ncbi:endonuclease/exonuclease/phosphatase family protein [Budviciaceae bacterium BWR-B9]|uniref:Endonuclease/exonuclease/phosphatase family protein n=1 Tax=Limnobaculum allomyrinae TaxID=2791986 RepID=A0ABS1IUU7_9GAMM|nr:MULTISPECIES: endonuclease/exonuclease/phosphatase family protein [Limnobaculum]MBK5145457.1 endonuclease/exonuclease/phosphatase family protein [Limnobaculum allomyrinae]MBV7693115.1 endonuclease/exonuclease/phosphatase family protein [Limnobaculum sp. M2-1]
MRKKNFAMRYSAGSPAERIFPGIIGELSQTIAPLQALPTNGALSVMVWNIFKQQRANWLNVLKKHGLESQLVLLQEAQTTPELINFATSNYLAADQVPAIVMPQYSSGVMTLASANPIYCCPLREREPLLRLSKSALVTVYPLDDGRQLMVANIHAVNFSIGVDIYQQQLKPIGEQILQHKGPVILAGDFNAWSRQRLHSLYRFSTLTGLQEVRFSHDWRKKAFGRPLDFIFYRGLQVEEASVLVTQASDHNPLLVRFHANP